MKKLILALLCVAPCAHAQYLNGNKLLELMESDNEVRQTMAMGFVTGVADANQAKLCVPDKASVKQITDVVRDTLKQVPSVRHEPAALIVVAALGVAFPCKGAL